MTRIELAFEAAFAGQNEVAEEALEARGVPCGRINNLAQVFADPQVRHPVRISGDALAAMKAPPTLGQDTDQVLQQMLGLADADIARLRAQRLV